MKLYDQIIAQTMEALGPAEMVRRYPYRTGRVWKDAGSSELIMLRDTAFELGGSGLPSVNYSCVTTSGLIAENEIYVCGRDLDDIGEDTAFARIVLLETEDLGDNEEKAFQAIRNLDFVRYHIFPKGYMVRVSSTSHQERVRVSRQVVRSGIRFEYVGAAYIRKYLKIPLVRHVRVIFVTDTEPVKRLVPFAEKVSNITKTLTHILDGLPADCGHCSMKTVCDEVEGMRELHLGKGKK